MTTEATQTIGQQIRELRNGQGLSQAQLASLSGISQGYLSEVESGEKIPRALVLKNLAEVLMCRVQAARLVPLVL